MSANVRIVLVEPREAGNVGAVARSMKNFGFHDLVVVGESVPQQSNALWWSSGAEDLLQTARAVPSLHEALRDVHYSVATTSSRGRTIAERETPLTPRQVATLRHEKSGDESIALVFGREDHGLTAAEAMLCQAIAVIPTAPEFPTMNLAQSVAVFCYELASSNGDAVQKERDGDIVPLGLIERLHERAAALLLEVGFLHGDNPDRVYPEIRALTARMQLTTRETSVLLAMIRQIEWKLQALAAGT